MRGVGSEGSAGAARRGEAGAPPATAGAGRTAGPRCERKGGGCVDPPTPTRTNTATPTAAAAHTHGERPCSAPTTGATRGSEVDAGSADTVTEPGANAATDAGTGATAADEVAAAGRAAVTPGTDASS